CHCELTHIIHSADVEQSGHSASAQLPPQKSAIFGDPASRKASHCHPQKSSTFWGPRSLAPRLLQPVQPSLASLRLQKSASAPCPACSSILFMNRVGKNYN